MLLHPEDKITLRQVKSLLPISKLLDSVGDPEFQHALRIKIEREGVSDVVKTFVMENLWHNVTYGGGDKFVKFALKLPGIDVNAAKHDGHTLLHSATWGGHTDVVAALLAHPEINANAANKFGYTPLHSATSERRTEVVVALLAHPGIDVNAANWSGRTPLYIAKQRKNTEIATILLAHPDNIN